MSMHGIRDAACNWSAEYTATLLAIGYLQGRHNPCLLRHPKTDVSAIVHGDAFITLRNAESLLAMRKTLRKYRLKVEALGKSEGCAEEVEIFNKVVRRTNDGIELEADPRHSEIVVKDFGLVDAKPSRVPGRKVRDEVTGGDDAGGTD